MPGKPIHESRVRAYLKCSQYYQFGGVVEPEIKTHMFKVALERWLAHSLKSPERSQSYLLSKAVNTARSHCKLDQNYLIGQVNSILNETYLTLDSFFRLFPEETYKVVQGPTPWMVKLGSTSVELHFSGMLRTSKYQTLHLLDITPYPGRQDQANDPVQQLKLYALSKHVSKHPQRPQAILHTLWVSEAGILQHRTLTSEEVELNYLKLFKGKLGQIGAEIYFPLIPCPFACPYKSKCSPKREK